MRDKLKAARRFTKSKKGEHHHEHKRTQKHSEEFAEIQAHAGRTANRDCKP